MSLKSTLSDLSSCYSDINKPSLLDDVAVLALQPCNDELPDGWLRLVDWTVELLSKLLKNIVANRGKSVKPKRPIAPFQTKPGQTPFDEFAQSIDLPEKSPENVDGSNVQLSAKVVQQLREFVFNIACLHGRNPFHNVRHGREIR